jgi:cyclopropane-fatty-acyl-phospholipid synthase
VFEAQMRVRDWRVFGAVLRSGDVGLGRSFIEGDWDSEDIAALLLLLARGRDAIDRLIYGGRMGGLLLRIRHLLNANTRRGARRNILAHYDLGNAFYGLWLDRSMTYSAALFEGQPGRTLEEAQRAKVARALDQLGVGPEHRVLEIGCGWGTLAIAAAARGASVTGISLSDAQTEWARSAARDAGCAERIDFQIRDYRDLEARYDRIASIEMIEAVGERYWPRYFAAIRGALADDGIALVQAITIGDRYFEAYRRGTDFIQQYVFPGGMLPSPSRLAAEAAAQGLHITRTLSFGGDYAETLRRWRSTFMAEENAVRALGFDTDFIRLWQFYLAYCEAGFDAGICDVAQFTLQPSAPEPTPVQPG